MRLDRHTDQIVTIITFYNSIHVTKYCNNNYVNRMEYNAADKVVETSIG